jgi:hypothetical protein
MIPASSKVMALIPSPGHHNLRAPVHTATV